MQEHGSLVRTFFKSANVVPGTATGSLLVGPQSRTLEPDAGAANASNMVDNARAAVNLGPQTQYHESANVAPGTANGSHGHPARDRHWLTTDFANMRKAELRNAAVALGVFKDIKKTARPSGQSARQQWRVRARC